MSPAWVACLLVLRFASGANVSTDATTTAVTTVLTTLNATSSTASTKTTVVTTAATNLTNVTSTTAAIPTTTANSSATTSTTTRATTTIATTTATTTLNRTSTTAATASNATNSTVTVTPTTTTTTLSRNSTTAAIASNSTNSSVTTAPTATTTTLNRNSTTVATTSTTKNGSVTATTTARAATATTTTTKPSTTPTTMTTTTTPVYTPSPRWPPYTYKAVLNDNFVLFWTPNRTTHEITIEIQAHTTGFVGFGFGTGNGMAGADIVVGGVKDGTGYVQDRHGTQNGITPTLDSQQDWKLLNAEEKDNVTSLRYSRLFDTGDCDNDIVITADTMNIIWSYHATSDSLQYHGLVNRGQLNLQLLDNSRPAQLVDTPADMKTFDFLMPNVTIPASRSTLYWCQVFAVPNVTSKHHIVKYASVIDKAAVVHHMVGYGCYNKISTALLNTGMECYTSAFPRELSNCAEGTLGWAVGGDEYMYLPPQAGISLGTANDIKFVMIEMHYNNVDGKDWHDRSGYRIYYTPTLRQFDVGTLTLGAIGETQIIPPKSLFTTVGVCPEDCTRKFITDQSGIHVTNYLLHSHLLGRQMRVRHVRNGTQIGWLGKDEHYGFNYQQVRMFNEEKIILPGDSMITECGYDSSDRDTTTYGGLSTQEEMCLAFLCYYPRMQLNQCFSETSAQSQASIFNASVQIDSDRIIQTPANYEGEYFTSLFSHTFWTDELVRRLQDVQRTQPHITACGYVNNSMVSYSMQAVPYPAFKALDLREGNCSLPRGSPEPIIATSRAAATATATPTSTKAASSATRCTPSGYPLFILVTFALPMHMFTTC